MRNISQYQVGLKNDGNESRRPFLAKDESKIEVEQPLPELTNYRTLAEPEASRHHHSTGLKFRHLGFQVLMYCFAVFQTDKHGLD